MPDAKTKNQRLTKPAKATQNIITHRYRKQENSPSITNLTLWYYKKTATDPPLHRRPIAGSSALPFSMLHPLTSTHRFLWPAPEQVQFVARPPPELQISCDLRHNNDNNHNETYDYYYYPYYNHHYFIIIINVIIILLLF